MKQVFFKKFLLVIVLMFCLSCSSFGYVEAASSDFEILDKVLVKYHGNNSMVTIPSGITVIGEFAFYNCKNLTSIIIF